jgi:hypothetical protein
VPITIVTDGLDGIEEHSRKPLLEALLKLPDASNLRLLLSSRAEIDIAKILRNGAVSIKIDLHNEDDIRKSIECEGKDWMDDLKEFEADKAMFAAAQDGLIQVQKGSEGKYSCFI